MGRALAATSTALRARRRASARARLWSRAAVLGIIAAVVLVVLGFVFAGSPDELAHGTKIAGVDVGGLTPTQARKELQRRADSLARVPVTFTASGRSFEL